MLDFYNRCANFVELSKIEKDEKDEKRYQELKSRKSEHIATLVNNPETLIYKDLKKKIDTWNDRLRVTLSWLGGVLADRFLAIAPLGVSHY